MSYNICDISVFILSIVSAILPPRMCGSLSKTVSGENIFPSVRISNTLYLAYIFLLVLIAFAYEVYFLA